MFCFLLSLVQFVLIAAVCVFETKRKSPVSFMWATLFVMFGVTHMFGILIEETSYSEMTLNYASLFVIGFCLVYLATRYLLFHALLARMKRVFLVISIKKMAYNKDFPIFYSLFFVAVLSLTMETIRYSGGILNTSWFVDRERLGTVAYVSTSQIFSILYFALGGLLTCAILRQNAKKAIIACSMIVFMELITRNRIYVTPLLVGAIAPTLIKFKKINIKLVCYAILAAVGAIFLIYGLRAFRYYGSLASAIRDFNFHDFIEQILIFFKTSNGELGLRKTFYFFIERNNQFPSFGKGHTYLRMLLIFLPTRFSFGLKPSDFAQAMGAAVGMSAGGSTHPTLFGDCYANFGAFGFLAGLFWALLAGVLDSILLSFRENECKVLAYSLLACMYIIIGRGAVYNAFFNIVYGLIILKILESVVRHAPSVAIRF